MLSVLVDCFTGEEDAEAYKYFLEASMDSAYWLPKVTVKYISPHWDLYISTCFPFDSYAEFLSESLQLLSCVHGEQLSELVIAHPN